MKIFRHLAILTSLTLCLTFTGTTNAAANSPIPKEEKQRIESYLNSLTTVKAEFIQAAPDGSLATGSFYLSRPGKIRWQYEPPVPLLIIVNGSFLTYYDAELEEVSYIPVGNTLASFLAKEKISLSKDVTITDYQKGSGITRVTLVKTEAPDEGALTLVMNNSPLRIEQLEVTDATQQLTTVSFNNAKYGMPLKEELFTLKNPKTFRKKN